MSTHDTAESDSLVSCTLQDVVLYFLRLGTLGFGGPIALAGAMQRDLVEERRWLSKQDYSEGLALAQLAPGPLAAQLAIYLGWVRGGVLGASLVGFAFVLPSFLMVLVLASLYVRFGGMPWLQAAFYGIGAAVIALIARGAHKLALSTARRSLIDVPTVLVALMTLAVLLRFKKVQEPLVIVAAGVVGVVLHTLR